MLSTFTSTWHWQYLMLELWFYLLTHVSIITYILSTSVKKSYPLHVSYCIQKHGGDPAPLIWCSGREGSIRFVTCNTQQIPKAIWGRGQKHTWETRGLYTYEAISSRRKHAHLHSITILEKKFESKTAVLMNTNWY